MTHKFNNLNWIYKIVVWIEIMTKKYSVTFVKIFIFHYIFVNIHKNVF